MSAREPLSMLRIVDTAVVLPRGRRTVNQLAASSGLTTDQVRGWTRSPSFPILDENESLVGLSTDAVEVLRAAQPQTVAAVDTVIVAGTGPWDHPAWSPAAAVARAAGLRGVHAFEATNFCNSLALVARLALDRAAARPNGTTLVVLQDRLSSLVDASDPNSAELFNYGDGVAALLLAAGPGPGRFLIRDAESVTDPTWVDEFTGAHLLHRPGVTLRRAGARRGLRARYVEVFRDLTKSVLTRASLSIDDIALVLLNHGDRTTHELTLEALEVPKERSRFHYDRLAHQGNADTLLALSEATVTSGLRPGDHTLHLTSGLGFSWGATLLTVISP